MTLLWLVFLNFPAHSRRVKRLDRSKFEEMAATAKVLSRDRHGLKVLQLSEGNIAKIFRVKHVVSSARFRPYSTRFVSNVNGLGERGIPTVKVLEHFKVPEVKREIVIYEPLRGIALREAVSSGAGSLEKLPAFLAGLHEKGIFFRSIHFGNIILCPDGNFGLIDVADLQFRKWRRLHLLERARNFKHLSRYKVDRIAIANFGAEKLVDAYLHASRMNSLAKRLGRKFFLRAITD